MKKPKSVIPLLLVSALLASPLGGCMSKAPENKAEGEVRAEMSEPVVIDWIPQNDQPNDPNSPIKKEIEKRFNVKINFVYIDRNKEKELLNIRVASGEIPDVMKIDATTYRNYGDQGALGEIPEDKLKKISPNMYSITKKNGGDYIWELAKQNGKISGVPYLNQNGVYSYTPIWRTDWLKNVGINKIPESLQEAEEAFYKFVNNDPDKNGKKDTYALSSTGLNTVLGAFGGIAYNLGLYWIEKDEKLIPTATMPEMKDGLNLLSKWYKDGLIDPEFISGENKGQNKYYSVSFWNGKIGFSTPGTYYHISPPLTKEDTGSENYINFKKLQPNGVYEVGKPLAGPSGKSGTQAWGTFGGTYIAMGRNTAKNPAKLDKILEIMEATVSDFDFYVFSSFGRKDIDYQLADGEYSFIGAARDKTYRQKNAFQTNGIGTCENNFEFKYRIKPALYQYADKVAKTPQYVDPVCVGLPSESKFRADLNRKIMEYYTLAITGDKKVSDFDSFVNDLKRSGLDQLVKEANDWYSNIKMKQ